MPSKKIVLAALLGGLVVFMWGAISHMVLPLGEVGIRALPNEDAVITVMQANLRETGFYFFPGYDKSAQMSKPDQDAVIQKWEEKYRRGPTGILIYRPQGEQPMSPAQLMRELFSNIAAALIVALLLSWASAGIAGYGGRVFFVALIGIFAGLEIDVSYWNWYGFPANYTLAAITDHFAGWLFAGLVMAAIVKRPS